MSLAVTFPGQGSQVVGMGKELSDRYEAAASVFAEVDDVLSEPLSNTIWQGPPETLTLTANAQPALMAVSIAVMRVLETKGFSIAESASHVAGHSLGEYSALCAAGAISLSDTAKLLRIRGNAMQDAVPSGKGAMAAIIGLERADVEAICLEYRADGCCQIANDNGGGQLVISGSKPEVERAASAASEKGAKRAIILPVSAPFHSALMQPAADVMREALENTEIKTPIVPVISNVSAVPVSDPDEIRRCLVEQVTGQVRWNESILWLVENGTTILLEAGSGKVLTGLARRISRDVKGVAVGTPGDIDKALELIR